MYAWKLIGNLDKIVFKLNIGQTEITNMKPVTNKRI